MGEEAKELFALKSAKEELALMPTGDCVALCTGRAANETAVLSGGFPKADMLVLRVRILGAYGRRDATVTVSDFWKNSAGRRDFACVMIERALVL